MLSFGTKLMLVLDYHSLKVVVPKMDARIETVDCWCGGVNTET